MQYRTMSIIIAVLLIGCADTQEDARRELRELDIPYSEQSFMETAEEGDPVAIDLFVKAGMNPNVTDDEGRTALIRAAEAGHTTVVTTLFEAGTDPNLGGRSGETALLRAAFQGHTNVVEFLLSEANVDVNQTGDDGQTALIMAASTGEPRTVELLLRYGADPTVKTTDGRTAMDMSMLIKQLYEDGGTVTGVSKTDVDKVFELLTKVAANN